MPRSHSDTDPSAYSYDDVQTYLARGRALRAAYMSAALRRFGRMMIGRGAGPIRGANQAAPAATNLHQSGHC